MNPFRNVVPNGEIPLLNTVELYVFEWLRRAASIFTSDQRVCRRDTPYQHRIVSVSESKKKRKRKEKTLRG